MNEVSPDTRVYFVSTGRVGTTYLSDCLGEVVPGGIEHQQAGARPLNVLGHLSMQVRAPALARLSLSALRRTDRPPSTSDPLSSIALALVRGPLADPSDVFVHLVRDPRDVVRSFMNWKRGAIKRTVLHHAVPLWQPTPLLDTDIGLVETVRMSKAERFAWVWERKNLWFEQLVGAHPNYYRFRTEDLVGADRKNAEVQRLLDAVGARSDPWSDVPQRASRAVNASVGGFPNWTEWTPELARAVRRRAGGLMEAYGYGDEPEWTRLLHE